MQEWDVLYISEAIQWESLSIGQLCSEQSIKKQLIPVERFLNISLPHLRAHFSDAQIQDSGLEMRKTLSRVFPIFPSLTFTLQEL
jgi:hypothetical protein